MLSRRSVRVKVMQLLYAKSSDASLDMKASNQRYSRMIEDSYDVFLFTLFVLVQISKVASTDEDKKRAKHLPTDADKAFSAKLATNELVKSLRDNTALIKIFEDRGFPGKCDLDHFKKLYYEFAKEDSYVDYLSKECTREDHVEILLELFRFFSWR